MSCQVFLAAGFSGHGFKFGPAIGQIMASLALDEDPGLPIGRFRLDRFTEEQVRDYRAQAVHPKLRCYK
jgi:glycine/D-amino acid oxidase-like deaminating enzyme